MNLEIISKYPIESRHTTPLLFVHGAWHGAWCWKVHLLDFFASHGFSAHALSLRGHGNSAGRGDLRGTRIADFVDDVAEVARQLPKPPVVIGHSMGGLVVQKYLQKYPAPVAVLLAAVPPQSPGHDPQDCRAASAHLRESQSDVKPLSAGSHSLIGTRSLLLGRPGRR
jgi:pimeloyl-ACP methyl ester carboxylesterase